MRERYFDKRAFAYGIIPQSGTMSFEFLRVAPDAAQQRSGDQSHTLKPCRCPWTPNFRFAPSGVALEDFSRHFQAGVDGRRNRGR